MPHLGIIITKSWFGAGDKEEKKKKEGLSAIWCVILQFREKQTKSEFSLPSNHCHE